ncbi:MAG: TIGR02647 family protein [Aeromonadaceae bacterium]
MRKEQLNQPSFIEDLNLLACYDLKNLELGIKLRQDCEPAMHAAALRLHAKGIITAADGGFLTPFGVILLEHLDHLLMALVAEQP